MTDNVGTVTSFTRGQSAFHTYTAPEAGFRVNTHIIETTELTVIDSQLAPVLARTPSSSARPLSPICTSTS